MTALGQSKWLQGRGMTVKIRMISRPSRSLLPVTEGIEKAQDCG